MSLTPSDPSPWSDSSPDDLVIEVAGVDVDDDLAAVVDPRGHSNVVRFGPVVLAARRNRFGFSIQAFAEFETADGDEARGWRVVHHETIGAGRLDVLEERIPFRVGHPCESDPAYRRLSSSGMAELGNVLGAPGSLWLHPSRHALLRFRRRALVQADAAASRLDVTIRALARVPVMLREPAMTAIDADSSGRIAALLASRPATVCGLGIAMGDRPDAWARDGRLSAPLQLAAAGYHDRDVLCAALETGRGLAPTESRLARLELYARRLLAHGLYEVLGDHLAYLGAALDVECRPSWLAAPQGGIGEWAKAQCWAEARDVPAEGKTYVSRHGASVVRTLMGFDRARSFVDDALDEAIRNGARSLMREGLAPAAALARVLARPFPVALGMSDHASLEGISIRRVRDGSELRAIGRAMRNCLSATDLRSTVSAYSGGSVFFIAEWDGGRVLAEVANGADGWYVAEVEGPENSSLELADHRRVLAALRLVVPGVEVESAIDVAPEDPPDEWDEEQEPQQLWLLHLQACA